MTRGLGVLMALAGTGLLLDPRSGRRTATGFGLALGLLLAGAVLLAEPREGNRP